MEEETKQKLSAKEQEALQEVNDEQSADEEVKAILNAISSKRSDQRTQIVLNKTERPNSFQFRLAGPGSEVKLYFESVDDLSDQVKEIAQHPHLSVYLAEAKKKYTEEKG